MSNNGRGEIMYNKNNVEILREKISAFIDSSGFLEIMELKQFLNDLPYDSITVKDFDGVMEEFEGINTTVDFLLLKYSVDQCLFYESQTK